MMQSFTSREPLFRGFGDIEAGLLELVHFTNGKEPLEGPVKNGKLMGYQYHVSDRVYIYAIATCLYS